MTQNTKRLVFSFDGTWNRLDQPCPTNVLLTAESVLPIDGKGIAQLNYYDQGVGTGGADYLAGGMLGTGLTENLADAYLNLVFNYMPGDEIFIFGFSRGAFSARSFAGLIKNCGVVRREHASKTKQAIALYQSRRDSDAPWSDKAGAFRAEYAHPLPEIQYLGVWDTVGALGIPNHLRLARLFNGKYRFHDCSLSSMVRSARHAVAIDETRRAFEPTLWDNFEALNRAAGKDPEAADAPYQQKWFPGVHSVVGGGMPERGLSDQALEWVWAGARQAGLALDTSASSRLYSLNPDYRGPVNGVAPGGRRPLSDRLWSRSARANGPQAVHHVSMAARRRWHAAADELPEKQAYKPKSLAAVEAAMAADAECQSRPEVPPEGTFEIVVVERGDSLGTIAKHHLGDPARWKEVYGANRDKLADPDRIYCGMTLRVPKQTC